MNNKDIAYTARVSAAVWMIRKARKIASLLSDRMPDEQQAIEEEIVAIGRRMYDEAWQQKTKLEVTHDPHARAKSRFEFGDESERDAYVADVVDHIAEATHDPGEDHELEAYVAAVRELVPDAGPKLIALYRSRGLSIEEAAGDYWRLFGIPDRSEKQ